MPGSFPVNEVDNIKPLPAIFRRLANKKRHRVDPTEEAEGLLDSDKENIENHKKPWLASLT